MKISTNSIVTFHYTVKDNEENLIDSSEGTDNPLSYIHGKGEIIKGLEDFLEGQEKGFKDKVIIPAEKAYGEYSDELLEEIPLDIFKGVENLTPGMQFELTSEAGSKIVSLQEVKENTVIVDGNHPLAGKELYFEVNILDVKEATEEELNPKGNCGCDEGCC